MGNIISSSMTQIKEDSELVNVKLSLYFAYGTKTSE